MSRLETIDRRTFLGGAIAAGLGTVLHSVGNASARTSGLFAHVSAASREIPATPGAFHILVLGDSYAWQPGLLLPEKSCSLVRQHCVQVLQGYRDVAPLRIFARSGAVIGELNYDPQYLTRDDAAPWPGDVPDAFWDDPHPGGDFSYAAPSIWRQLQRAQDPHARGYVNPQLVDLVLASGGGNDVAITNVVAPRAGPNHHAGFRQWIDTLCGDRMKRLLPAIADAFPNAKIVVTGYPQVISDNTDSWELAKYLGALGVTATGVVAGTGGILPAIALVALATPIVKEASKEQSATFAEESSKVLQEAVDEVNAARGVRRAAFADVRAQWGAMNAYGAPDSFFWHFTAPSRPPDHTADARNAICTTHTQVAGTPLDIECVHGAMGHPNVDGAGAYAAAVNTALETFGASWPGLGPISIKVERVSSTNTAQTIIVRATDRNGQRLDATVQVYGVTGRTDTLLTYPKTPPADCLSVEGGDVTTDPRGKPHRSNKSTVNVCSGTVSKLGYLTAEFKP